MGYLTNTQPLCKNPPFISIQKRQRQIWSVWANKVDIESLSAVACALIPAPVFFEKGTLGAVTNQPVVLLKLGTEGKNLCNFKTHDNAVSGTSYPVHLFPSSQFVPPGNAASYFLSKGICLEDTAYF